MSDLHRRSFLLAAAASVAALRGSRAATGDREVLPFANGERPLIRYPGKRALIRLTTRPPQLETPFAVFDKGVLTPNDAFFVRYHLSDLPLGIDPAAHRLEIKGKVEKPLSLSLHELKRDFEPAEIVAVNQCSGNSRGFFEPRVGGGQLGNGAMGNARWHGVALKALLDKAGVQAGARQVIFDGLDKPPLADMPDFVKALDIDHARDGEVMVAFRMNGADLPWLNGYPLRLVVPGYYGTYWVKHLAAITVLDKDFDGFWMKTAYRIPDNHCACTKPGEAATTTRPIGRFNVRSFITNLTEGAKVGADRPTLIRGVAFDGGQGIKEVRISADGGASWTRAKLGEDLGRYSFRQWRLQLPLAKGAHEIKARAVSNSGEEQPLTSLWNPPGYMRNVVETVRVEAV